MILCIFVLFVHESEQITIIGDGRNKYNLPQKGTVKKYADQNRTDCCVI
jgi:beta-lactamase superfamily II metal-dependent hydrolase